MFHAYLNGVTCRGVSPLALSFIYQMFSGGVTPPLLNYARNEIIKPTLCKGKWHEVTDETERKGVGRVALDSAKSKAVS